MRIYSTSQESTNTREFAPSTKSKETSVKVAEIAAEGESAQVRSFSRPFPSTQSRSNVSAGYNSSGVHIPHNDLVVQRDYALAGEEAGGSGQQGIFVERRFFVESSPNDERKRIDFLEDASD